MPDDTFNYAGEIEYLENAGVNPSEAKAIVGMTQRAVNSGAQKADIAVLIGKIEVLHERIDALDSKIDVNYAALDAKSDNVHQTLNAKIDAHQDINNANFAIVREEIKSSQQRTVIILGIMIGGGVVILTAVITVAAWFLSTVG